MIKKDKLDKISQLQQSIEKYGKLPIEILNKINYKFRLEWNYNSNRMEGNTLTKDETRSVMIGNVTVRDKSIKEMIEMQGHDKVISSILKIGKGELNLSENRIKEIHKGIMDEEDPEKIKLIGQWKKDPNEVINYKDEKFGFSKPSEVKDQMHGLMNWLNTEKEKIEHGAKNAIHPAEIAFKFHLDYLTIHPFYDGNGRTARILMNLILIAYGLPPIYIKEEEKDTYYKYLGDIQGYGGDPDLLYNFLADLLIRSLQIVLDAIDGKEIDEATDLDKEVAMLDKKLEGYGDKIEKVKDKVVMDALLAEVLVPLFRNVFAKILKLAPLFADIEFTFYIEGSGSSHNNIDNLVQDFKLCWNNKEHEIRDASFNIQLIRLKKLGTDAFDVHASVNFKFESHKYQVIFFEETVERLYHQLLTESEIDQIGTRFVRAILKQTEEQAENRVKNSKKK